MVVVFEGEAGGSAGGGESKLIDDLFPHFVVGDGLATALFADGLVEFEEVELLSTDLGYFDLGDALRGPILT